jgi:hypothetical protein
LSILDRRARVWFSRASVRFPSTGVEDDIARKPRNGPLIPIVIHRLENVEDKRKKKEEIVGRRDISRVHNIQFSSPSPRHPHRVLNHAQHTQQRTGYTHFGLWTQGLAWRWRRGQSSATWATCSWASGWTSTSC